jgi:hypothetical protein
MIKCTATEHNMHNIHIRVYVKTSGVDPELFVRQDVNFIINHLFDNFYYRVINKNKFFLKSKFENISLELLVWWYRINI